MEGIPRSFAITGSPGTGKTTLAVELVAHGIMTRPLLELASEHDCVDPPESDGARPVDTVRLKRALAGTDLRVEGHLAHLIVDEDAPIVVLRCHPVVLRNRLEARQYPPSKVRANVEWELLGGTMMEANHPRVLELDTTSSTTTDLARSLIEWFRSGCAPQPSRIEWMSETTAAMFNP